MKLVRLLLPEIYLSRVPGTLAVLCIREPEPLASLFIRMPVLPALFVKVPVTVSDARGLMVIFAPASMFRFYVHWDGPIRNDREWCFRSSRPCGW